MPAGIGSSVPSGYVQRRRKDRASNTRSYLQKYIRRQIQLSGETKHKTFTASSWVDIGATSGTLTELTSISQGVGDNERVGNKIQLQKIYVQKLLRVEDNVSVPHTTIRVLLVQSRAGSLSTSDMPGFAQPVDLDKMIVLKDMMVNLSSTGQNSSGTYFGSNPKRIKFNLRKLYKKFLQYNDTVTTPANNPLYLYMFSDNAYGQQCGFETVYYKDM